MTASVFISVIRVSIACCCAGWLIPLVAVAQQSPPELVEDNLPRDLRIDHIPRGLAAERPVPEDNQLSDTRVQLGRRLFFDARLSADQSVACASCHRPDQGFATNDVKSVGIRGAVGRRNVPTLLNRAFGKRMFWDGRAETLEQQALLPITNETELANTVETVIQRLKQDPSYVEAFDRAYEGGITPDNLARAIASFERVLLSGDSGVDRFRASNYAALSTEARQGMWIFESSGGCWKCHSGKNFSDEQFHNTGVGWGVQPLDLGLYEFTKQDADRGKFKTPTLRDVALTAPYMHDGSVKTLRDVVEYYNRGGNRNENIDADLQPLELTDQQLDHLVAFLEALTGDPPWQPAAASPAESAD